MPPVKIDHAKVGELISAQDAVLNSQKTEAEKKVIARQLVKSFSDVEIEPKSEITALAKLDDANDLMAEMVESGKFTAQEAIGEISKNANAGKSVIDMRLFYLGQDNIVGKTLEKTTEVVDPGDDDDEDEDDEDDAAAAKDEVTPVDFKQKLSIADIFSKSKSLSHLKYDDQHDVISINREVAVCRGEFGKPDLMNPVKSEKDEDDNDFRPTADELSKINAYTKKNFPAEAFKVYFTKSADMNVDAHYEHFSKKALKDMADNSPGAPVIKDHDTWRSDGAFGKIFDAKVAKDADGTYYLMQKFYIPDDEENKSLIAGIEKGINDKLSVGISLDRSEYICDVCNKAMFGKSGSWGDWCGHYPGYKTGEGDKAVVATATINRVAKFRELSRVVSPAQAKAQINPKKSFAGLSKSDSDKLVEISEKGFDKNADLNLLFNKNNSSAKLSTAQESKNSGEVKNVDELQKLLDSQKLQIESQTKQIESQDKMLEKLEANLTKQQEFIDSVNKLLEAQVDWKKEVTVKMEVFEKQVEERGVALQMLLKSTVEFQKQCGIVVGKSLHDVAQEQHSKKEMSSTREEAQRDKQNGAGFYKDVFSEISKVAAES